MKEHEVGKLFSKGDIASIEREASENLQFYLGTGVGDGNATEKSIMTISSQNKLIFVVGNEYTGFSHLRDRHDTFSTENYWVKIDDVNFRLDKPSKFHPEMMPIVHFVRIADDIFKLENSNIQKNKRPDIFDMYSGLSVDLDERSEKYHLLTYKDSKVVHTLNPHKKKHNRNNKFPFAKGIVTKTLYFPPGYNDLIVPYENEKGLMAYSLLLRKSYAEKIERWFIREHDKEGNVIYMYHLYERNFETFEQFDHETVLAYQFRNLTDIESWIMQLINGLDETDE